MRLAFGAVVALLAGSACTHATAADPDPKQLVETDRHVHTYEVNPLAPGALAQAIAAERKRFGSTAIGQTAMHMSLHFAIAQIPSGPCVLAQVKVHVETTISIPEWNAPPGTSGARLGWWQHIVGDVTDHERHHVAIAEESGATLAATLQPMTAADCHTLGTLVNNALHSEQERMLARQSQFDQQEGVMMIAAPPP